MLLQSLLCLFSEHGKRSSFCIAAVFCQVTLLVEEGFANVSTEDRWGHTPEGDAEAAGHSQVAQYLRSQVCFCLSTGAMAHCTLQGPTSEFTYHGTTECVD